MPWDRVSAPAGRQAAGLRRQRLKLTGEGDLAVFAAGKTGEDLPAARFSSGEKRA